MVERLDQDKKLCLLFLDYSYKSVVAVERAKQEKKNRCI